MKLKLFLKPLIFMAMLFATAQGWCREFDVDGVRYSTTGTTATVIQKTPQYTGGIVIPNTITYSGITYTVTSIGWGAFSGCSGLTSVTIPNTVTNIGSSAFSGCSGLISVTIPNSIKNIESSAFSGCSGLSSVTIPNSVISIGYGAFQNCSGLNSVTIPNSVTSIGGDAFSGCSGLTSVTIPNSVTSIGNSAFVGTAWYNNLPDGLIYVGKILYKYKGTMPNNTNIVINQGTQGIASSAFSGCSGFTSVTIPNSVSSIGGWETFSSCSNLATVNFNADSCIRGGFGWCTALTTVNISDNVKCIPDDAFRGCKGLTSITIPNGVTSIGNSAFSDCRGLTSITIPNSVKSIGDFAFSNCNNLTSINLGKGLTTIGDGAFANDALEIEPAQFSFLEKTEEVQLDEKYFNNKY